MPAFKIQTAGEQAAAYLREELIKGRWRGFMPGADKLSRDTGIAGDTLRAALQILEKDGMLTGQGRRKKRAITLTEEHRKDRQLRIAILLYESSDRRLDYLVELRHRLQDMGHHAVFATESLRGMNMNVRRVARHVEKHPADAWVVVAGSRDVLLWFSEQAFPAFALFGRVVHVPIASCGPRKSIALIAALRKLVSLGHRRIVMLAREERLKPYPGTFERVFLAELEALGIPPNAYNLPDWENTPKGLQRILESLFAVTPPTALIIQGVPLFFAVQQHLARNGIFAPDHVSLVCTDADASFSWLEPSVCHFAWNELATVGRVTRWLDHVVKGKEDRRMTGFPTRFVEGGTIGPVK